MFPSSNLSLRWLLLIPVAAVAWMAGTSLSGLSASGASAPDPMAAIWLLVVMTAISGVYGWLIRRSRWTGWKLVSGLFLVFFGTMTVMSQIESIVFLQKHLPPGMVQRILWMGFIAAVVFAPLSVVVMGRLRPAGRFSRRYVGPDRSFARWVLWFVVLAAVYVVVYFIFGYYVAFRDPAVLEYYEGSDPGTFVGQLKATWASAPWLFGFQFVRGLLWVGLAVPVARLMSGGRGQIAMAVALVFALPALQLLIPNPFMPEAVRWTHLAETFPSNFLFGALTGWTLAGKRSRA